MVPVLRSNTRTDLTTVGRLHYSLRLALSAQFRRGICASDIDNAYQYLRTGRRRDSSRGVKRRSISNVPYLL
jgi:hypothetical protein